MAHVNNYTPKKGEEYELDPKHIVESKKPEQESEKDSGLGTGHAGSNIRKLCADMRHPPSSEFRWLYAGFVMSHIGSHIRIFAFMIIFTHIGGLRLIGANNLFDGFAIALVSARIGAWLDHTNRRRGALTLICVNAVCVAGVSLVLVALLTWAPNGLVGEHRSAPATTLDSVLIWTGLIAVVLMAAAVKCTNMALNYVYTVDWLIVLAEREIDHTPLSDRNAALNIINQLVGVFTPLVGGHLMARMDYRHGALITAACCLVGLLCEGVVLAYLYAHVDELRAKRRHHTLRASVVSQTMCDAPRHSSSGSGRQRRRRFRASRLVPGLREYFQQACLFAALAMALHHISIIGVGGTSMSYAKENGLGANHIGQFSSAGHALGFVAAISYPLMVAAVGVKTTGFVGLAMHVFFLAFCVVSIWMPGSLTSLSLIAPPATNGSHNSLGHHAHRGHGHEHDSTSLALNTTTVSSATSDHSKTSILVYLSAITLAKFGGTAAHIAVHQLMQESIDETIRGAVFGTQSSLGQLCTMAADTALVILPEISTFGLLIAGSYVFMLVSFGFYCYYYFVVDKKIR